MKFLPKANCTFLVMIFEFLLSRMCLLAVDMLTPVLLIDLCLIVIWMVYMGLEQTVPAGLQTKDNITVAAVKKRLTSD